MKSKLFFISTLLLSLTIQAQITFEKGYFIGNNDARTECLIKNLDWKNNPTNFEYKLQENENPKTQQISNVKEFGIDAISKYKRFSIKIDTSSTRLNELSYKRRPEYKEVTIFLKTLIEGEFNLYYFEDGYVQKYFYDNDAQDIEELIHKQFIREHNKIGTNNFYKQQLYNNLKCNGISIGEINKVNYEKKDLINFFEKYNLCQNADIVNYNSIIEKRDLFNLRIRPGVAYSSLNISNTTRTQKTINFDGEIGLRFGLEVEEILPFNKNKWSIFAEPTFQYYQTATESSDGATKVDYKSIEVPIGVRHYFFLKNKSKIFFNAAYVIDFPLKSSIGRERGTDLKIVTRNNIIFGIGYDYKNRFNMELRYGISREVLNSYVYWSSNYTSASLIFGYLLF